MDTWECRSEIPETFEMWHSRTLEISWTDYVKNQVLHRVKGERNILHSIKEVRRIVLVTSCIIKHVTEGKIEE
jgi:hypothetical protein